MLTKKVNGVDVVLTAEEEAETRAEWAANEAAQAQAEARKAACDVLLRDTPESDQSLPALWQAVNEIKAILRGDA